MPASLPLDGIRVLDLSHALAGPYCTMLLADLGADVIKLEPPGHGDHARQWGPPFIHEVSSYFLSVNRNKRSIVLDLKDESAKATARALAMRSDVVVENFTPGTAARLGLGAEELRTQKPALIYASISGYGQGHPELPGYDQIAQGTSGLMSITGEPDAPPTKVGVPIGDITAGMFAAHAILAALVERSRTGAGRFIDVALNDSLLAILTYQAGRFFATGEAPPREGNRHGAIAPYGTFAVSDGTLNLAVGSDSQFERLCDAIDAPELTADPRFRTNPERTAAREPLQAEIERRLLKHDRAFWMERLGRHGVPTGPILDVAEAFASPMAKARNVRVEVEHPILGRLSQVATPWKLDGASSPIRRPPPLLGEHTDEVLAELKQLQHDH
jgi:crotonobetainyl-CoA:carnitine CoA-transferase CaiB-like acyl-CoA transferase